MNTSKWFERKFDFNFGVEEYPLIYQRLQQAPDMLAALLLHKPEQQLSHQPGGKWSVKEHVGHLVVLESLWRARVRDIVEKKHMLTATDLDNKATTEAGFNNYRLALLLEQFAGERRETLSLLDGIDTSALSHTSLHPRLQQPMRIIDIMYFTAEHDDHHLGVIRNLCVHQ
jgi:uncharacterized damage-inducible protein DinB